MRRLIADLRPSTLDELGLGAALEALGERTASGDAIEVEINARSRLRGRPQPSRLLGEIEDTVYRLVQEALNNAVQHGEADVVEVDVSESERDPAGAGPRRRTGLRPGAATDGFGLIGMRERAELAGGTPGAAERPGRGHDDRRRDPRRHREGKAEKAHRAWDQAGQGRRERGVLCTRATEDAEMRRSQA